MKLSIWTPTRSHAPQARAAGKAGLGRDGETPAYSALHPSWLTLVMEPQGTGESPARSMGWEKRNQPIR